MQLLEEKLQEEVIWPEQERSLFKLDGIAMWTKLRPGVRAMLAQLAPLFQLWIFTNGTRYMRMHCWWLMTAKDPLMQPLRRSGPPWCQRGPLAPGACTWRQER